MGSKTKSVVSRGGIKTSSLTTTSVNRPNFIVIGCYLGRSYLGTVGCYRGTIITNKPCHLKSIKPYIYTHDLKANKKK